MTGRIGQSRPRKPGMAKRGGCKLILGQKGPRATKKWGFSGCEQETYL